MRCSTHQSHKLRRICNTRRYSSCCPWDRFHQGNISQCLDRSNSPLRMVLGPLGSNRCHCLRRCSPHRRYDCSLHSRPQCPGRNTHPCHRSPARIHSNSRYQHKRNRRRNMYWSRCSRSQYPGRSSHHCRIEPGCLRSTRLRRSFPHLHNICRRQCT